MLKKLILAAAGLALAAPAFADGWHYGHDRDNHGPRFGYRPYSAPYRVHYRPVYVAPPRVVYAAPAYYYAPRVAIAAPLAPGVSIRFDFPL